MSIALEWLKSTFLYIRILKNPTYYGECKLLRFCFCVSSLNGVNEDFLFVILVEENPCIYQVEEHLFDKHLWPKRVKVTLFLRLSTKIYC